jgi:hypothetical protein
MIKCFNHPRTLSDPNCTEERKVAKKMLKEGREGGRNEEKERGKVKRGRKIFKDIIYISLNLTYQHLY